MEKTCLITKGYVKTMIRERPAEIHKGQCGRVLVIAGSRGMAGAAVLAAGAALRSGAGLVQVAVPDELFPILQTAVPQATCMSVFGELPYRALGIYDSIAIGPGLGVDEEKYGLIKHVLRDYNGPVVLDADGLNTMCRFDMDLAELKNRVSPVILTPHPGEGDRLLDALGEKMLRCSGRLEAVEFLCEKTGRTVLLKGAGTLVSAPGEKTYINTTGNPGMATGGSGDVLTGVIAALAAYGLSAADAARTGAFMHGLAGDIAAESLGQWGMTSLDIEMALPEAFKRITEEKHT